MMTKIAACRQPAGFRNFIWSCPVLSDSKCCVFSTGVPRTGRRGYRPGSDGDHGKGRWACARVGCGRAYWLYRDCIPIHTGVHTGHLTLLPPCPLDRQARAASLSTPAATEWTVLGSRPPPLVCLPSRSLARVHASARVVDICQPRLVVGVCTVNALR